MRPQLLALAWMGGVLFAFFAGSLLDTAAGHPVNFWQNLLGAAIGSGIGTVALTLMYGVRR